ncbi:DEGP1 [Scenedesmus sp. PABB004]|nr:DEGP1 [Scenedesmus sp. PABB004]
MRLRALQPSLCCAAPARERRRRCFPRAAAASGPHPPAQTPDQQQQGRLQQQASSSSSWWAAQLAGPRAAAALAGAIALSLASGGGGRRAAALAASMPPWPAAASTAAQAPPELERSALAAGAGAAAAAAPPAAAGPPAARGQEELLAHERATVALFEAASPSVVNICHLRSMSSFHTLDVHRMAVGQGSGFIWDTAGHVVTNYHVIRGAAEVKVTLHDHSSCTARVVGVDAAKDIAVLKLALPRARLEALTPVKLGLSGRLRVGQTVLALGNPFGLVRLAGPRGGPRRAARRGSPGSRAGPTLRARPCRAAQDHTLTQGVVSGLGRELSTGLSAVTGVIQTDAAINPGNSGGVLLNSQGAVVGVNLGIMDPSGKGSFSGVGFAIPIDTVRGLVDQILVHGRVRRPSLGITLAPEAVLAQLGTEGVLVLLAPANTPAAAAGLRPTYRDVFGDIVLGDIIVGVDTRPIRSVADLVAALDERRPGDKVRCDVLRDGKRLSMTVTLGERGTSDDCTLRLFEEPGDGHDRGGGGKRQRDEIVLPGHSMFLAGVSPVFQAKLENWSDAEPARKRARGSVSAAAGRQQHSLALAVPRGQLEVGRLLLQAAYAAQPASTLAGAEQERLLQLLVLADRYEVAKVTAAAGDALAAVPLKQLAWSTVAAVHALPPGCAELPVLRSIFKAVADKVQAELGDLELVWGEGEGSPRQLALLYLPHGELKQLLADERTRVASENTVCYTIIKWAERQAGPLPAALAKELVALVRMRHVTQLYFCGVASQSGPFQAGFTPGELMAASALCSRGAPAEDHFDALTKLPSLPSFPAWSAPARPVSFLERLALDWCVSAARLRTLVEEHLQQGHTSVFNCNALAWSGVALSLRVSISKARGEEVGPPRTNLGLYLCATDLPEGAVVSVETTSLSLRAAPGGQHGDEVKGPRNFGFSNAASCWGYRGMFSLGHIGSWADAEAALRRAGLLHTYGVACRAVVMRVL